MFRMRGTAWSAVTMAAGLLVADSAAEAQRGRPAAAQGAHRPIAFGTTVTDTLRESDPKRTGAGAFHTYRFTAKTSKRYVITMDADGFDAYVAVMRSIGGITDEVATNDDGAGGEGGTNSRLRFAPPADGEYILVAQSFTEEGLGAFALRVEEQEPPVMPPMQPIALGETANGAITDESPVSDDEEAMPYNHYRLRGNGERVRILMRSADFDALLVLYRIVPGGEDEEVAVDDDGGGNTDARLTVTLDGEYRLVARPLSVDGRGSYTLSVEAHEATQVESRPIRAGETVTGELTETDAELEDGAFYDEYVLEAAAGDEFRITMRSESMDSFLRWGSKDGLMFTEIASDDDSGGDLDSQLTVTVEERGRYVIRVSSLGAGAGGQYTLSVERLRP